MASGNFFGGQFFGGGFFGSIGPAPNPELPGSGGAGGGFAANVLAHKKKMQRYAHLAVLITLPLIEQGSQIFFSEQSPVGDEDDQRTLQ